MKNLLRAMMLSILALVLAPASAQTKPAPAAAPIKPAPDSMQVLREKLKADKKVVVALNLDLEPAEAKGFWPIYEEYQKELAKLNKRTADLIQRYAREYNTGSVKNDDARKMTDELISIEAAEVDAKRAVVPKLAKVMSGKRVARYMQIEGKIRAVVKYELADSVPLVP